MYFSRNPGMKLWSGLFSYNDGEEDEDEDKEEDDGENIESIKDDLNIIINKINKLN